MKILFLLTATIIIMAGCASSHKDKTPESFTNLITLQKPGDQPHQPSKVYVDSVKQVTVDKKEALLISGTFPDACTNLGEAKHHAQNDSLYLEISAWRNPDMMCAQVLTPFSYLYDTIDKKELSSHSEIIINGTAYQY